MGSPQRKAARAASRADQAKKAAATRKRNAAAKKAKEANGKPTAEEEAAAVVADNGVYVAIARGEDGKDIARIVPVAQGDVHPAEILTILEKAIKVHRLSLGLD